tara:strand:+ start:6571 stop:7434 length:864 start_codon:yes stop_codon:yes gene_type:complete
MHTKPPLSHRGQEPENGVLYLVGTPIGNLNDISARALNILKKVSLIACEDTRQTSKVLQKFAIKNILISFNKNNSYEKIPKLICDLKSGKSIALVSDAGMPGICDPGEDLVKNAKNKGVEIICIPGPCAAITALVTSGMPSSSFIFEGFLPKKKKEREKTILEISKSSKTIILYESPHRLLKLLNELKEYCGEDREIQVSRELTKRFEQHIKSDINDVIKYFESREIIGEFTIILKGKKKVKETQLNPVLIKKDLDELINAGLSLSAASKYLAKKNNLIKSQIYNLY